MKIERKEMKEAIKFLKEVQYNPVGGNSKLVLPVDMSSTKEIDGLSLDLVNNKFGSEKMPEPVLELKSTGDGAILSYCDLTYARKFDIVSYCDLIENRISKKARDLFNNLECFLVDKQNILISFNIEK